jgi:nicotinamide riboside kinase
MAEKEIRRICLYGGAGSGKSVACAQIFAALKCKHINIEQIQEYIKDMVYDGRKPRSFDQIYIFGKQMHKEDIVLRNGVDLIVTDSPVFLSACYAKLYKCPGWKNIIGLSHEFDNHFEPIHIFIERGNKPYQQKGRYGVKEDAIAMDVFIKNQLAQSGKKFHVFNRITKPVIQKLLKLTSNPNAA